jgi:hypothetical protein
MFHKVIQVLKYTVKAALRTVDIHSAIASRGSAAMVKFDTESTSKTGVIRLRQEFLQQALRF